MQDQEAEETSLRGRQVRPPRKEIAEAWRCIRAAASEGDIMACGLLVVLTDERLQASMAASTLLALAGLDGKRGAL